jgi:hypothetical protein
MAWLVGHREPKGAATAMSPLSPPRQSSTLPNSVVLDYDEVMQEGQAHNGMLALIDLVVQES